VVAPAREDRERDCLRGPDHGRAGSVEQERHGCGRHRTAVCAGEQPKGIEQTPAAGEEGRDQAVKCCQHKEDRGPLLVRLQDDEAQRDDGGADGQEQWCRGEREFAARTAEGLTTCRDRHDGPVAQERRHRECQLRLGLDPLVQLGHRQQEGERRQPRPGLPQRDRRDADERDSHVGHGDEVRLGTHERRRGQGCGEAEAGHHLGPAPDGDDRGQGGSDEDAREGHRRLDELVQRCRSEQRQADDGEADRSQHLTHGAFIAEQQDRARDEADRPADKSQCDLHAGVDPASAEGEAQEEHCAQQQSRSTDERQRSTGKALLDISEVDGPFARLGLDGCRREADVGARHGLRCHWRLWLSGR